MKRKNTKMKVWMDILSGDEMVSDSYPYSTSFDDACLEVKSKLITKNANDNFGIASMIFNEVLIVLNR